MLSNNTIDSFSNLRERVDRFFKENLKIKIHSSQLSFDIPICNELNYDLPTKNISEFINFLSDTVPDGDVYLFGGLLRDLALFGKKGFNSDIDIVVDGNWEACVYYLELKNSRKNKFGGYRLNVDGWQVDIWSAKDTWAIKQGFVNYKGVGSLINTTVLNWDSILMNWRTRNFITRDGYLRDLKQRKIDIVLENNPNPLGMAVRVFRHLCGKDAKSITYRAALYLSESTSKYTYEDIVNSELKSYGNIIIDPALYKFFELIKDSEAKKIKEKFESASNQFIESDITISSKQQDLNFNIAS